MSLRKPILKCHLSPGDIVMLTAALRDLHSCNPGKFITDVRTAAKDLWDFNPHVTPLKKDAADVEILQCHYPQIHKSNQTPYHFIHGFELFLSEKLGVPVNPSAFKGDIHLSGEEKSWLSQVHETLGKDYPFWIIVAGGKNDYTIKWWQTDRYQDVVDHFKGKILFVQVGEDGHNHPPLKGVLDLRGKTSIRQLVRLVHHSQGVLSPVTFLMPLAAAVESKPHAPSSRPCVVIAGGREPSHWESYPHHQFLHTQGALPCCQNGGCWKARTLPLGDGDPKDKPENRCVDVVGELPHCMDMITSKKAIEAIETYFEGGAISYMDEEDSKSIMETIDHDGFSSTITNKKLEKKTTANRVVLNHVTLRFVGLRRSGIHALQNWLAGLYKGKICFVNDANHQKIIQKNHSCNHLPAIDGIFNQEAQLDEEKNLLLLGYEDSRLTNLRKSPPKEELYGNSEKLRDVLLLRDPFNTFASRLHLRRKQPNNDFTKDFLLPDKNGISRLACRWKYYAHEYLGITHHLNHHKLTINYNRWLADKDYRLQLCETLVPCQA